MTDVARAYLDDIGASRTLRTRISAIQDHAEHLFGAAVIDLFVTDYVNDDGVRQFENLWLFTATGIIEAHSFLQKDEIDWVSRTALIHYIRLESESYGADGAVDRSRFLVRAASVGSTSLTFKASGGNCDHLMRILRTYIFPQAGVPTT